jgi:hypothetical protein
VKAGNRRISGTGINIACLLEKGQQMAPGQLIEMAQCRGIGIPQDVRPHLFRDSLGHVQVFDLG